jgi:hypothetical protein
LTEAIGYTGPAAALDVYARTGAPQPAMYRFRAACRLCGGPLERVLDLGFCALANEYLPAERAGEKQDEFPVVIGSCVACGHVQNMAIVEPGRLYSEYSYTSGVSHAFREHLQALATELYNAGHRTIVDIGSNDGTLLHCCRNLGMRCLGIDPARNLAAEASSSGALTIPAFFNVETAREIRRILGGAPDVVTAINSFAHTDALGEIADGVRELIGDSGVFVFEVAYLLDVLEKNEIGSLYLEHASTWAVREMQKFFGSRGLALLNVQRIAAQGGSLRVTVGDPRCNRNSATVHDMIADEERIPSILAAWPSRVAAEREAVAAMLEPYLGSLAIYGAPARLTVWAHAMGLKREDVTCVFDDEPRKVGRLTPGLHWPIVSSSELMARNPPAVLISAWPYAKDIMARFPDYRGVWLVPPRGTKIAKDEQ